MEYSIYLAFYSAAAAVLSVAFLIRFVFTNRKLNLPPGPMPLPIVGNLHQVAGPLPHQYLHKLSKRHGPIMHLRFGSLPVVVASSAEMARMFLKTHDVAFASRPKTTAGKLTTYNYSGIIWAPYGAYWRMARKICAAELFNAPRLQAFEHIRVEEVRSLLVGIFESAGKAVKMRKMLSTMVFNVMSRTMFGKVETLDDFSGAFGELSLLNAVLNIGDYVPSIAFMDLQGYVRRMKALSKKMDRFLEQVIDKHKERRNGVDGYVAKDMVDVLLQLVEDPTLEVELTTDGVKAFIQVLIVAGTETSIVTIEWTMSELLRHPDILVKATDELECVIGKDRSVEEKDLLHLPYMESIVKESMRLHPAAPLLAPHFSREDCVVANYSVPAGTQLIVNVWTIGRDPNIWEAPLDFRPERFLGKAIDVKGHDHELLPFGAGRRMCAGYSLGLKVVQLTLANLIHGFTWRLPDGVGWEDLSMDEGSGISAPKVPLEAVAKPRLPQNHYDV